MEKNSMYLESVWPTNWYTNRAKDWIWQSLHSNHLHHLSSTSTCQLVIRCNFLHPDLKMGHLLSLLDDVSIADYICSTPEKLRSYISGSTDRNISWQRKTTKQTLWSPSVKFRTYWILWSLEKSCATRISFLIIFGVLRAWSSYKMLWFSSRLVIFRTVWKQLPSFRLTSNNVNVSDIFMHDSGLNVSQNLQFFSLKPE